MNINKKDLKIEYMRGQGPGGQHKNKTDSACRITHIPTGISAYADTRNQHHSKRTAMRELERRLIDRKKEALAKDKKAKRDYAIHNTERIRTYDFSRGVVTDHRTGKVASLKNILEKGRLDLFHD
jgi:peptide chain release factor 1